MRPSLAGYPIDTLNPCAFCTSTWVDRAMRAANIRVTDLERRRLIAGMLARPHLIISGSTGIGKRHFTQALGLSIVNCQHARLLTIQGHPWWASKTGDVASSISLQTELSMLRLNDYVGSILEERHALPNDRATEYVICVEQLSPVEMQLYFEQFAQWLFWSRWKRSKPVSLRMIGVFDSVMPPKVDDQLLRFTAFIHLDGASPAINPNGRSHSNGKVSQTQH